MNRKILIQVTAPAVIIGLLLLGACLVGARYLNRLRENRGRIRAKRQRPPPSRAVP